MPVSSDAFIGYLYNKKLPRVYRDEDAKVDNHLYKYLSAASEAGFAPQLLEAENVLNLTDPEKCPDSFVKYLVTSFGFPFFEDIDIKYYRKFMLHIGELIQRRGTYSCVRYLVRVLTDMEVDLSYERGVYEGTDARWLHVEMKCATIAQLNSIDTEVKVIARFLQYFIPFYITLDVKGVVDTQVIENTSYSGGVITVGVSQVIRKT